MKNFLDLARHAVVGVLLVAAFVAVISAAAAGVQMMSPGAHPLLCLAIPVALLGMALGGAVYADDDGRF